MHDKLYALALLSFCEVEFKNKYPTDIFEKHITINIGYVID